MAAFNSLYCKKNCLPRDKTVVVPGMIEVPDIPPYLVNEDPLYKPNVGVDEIAAVLSNIKHRELSQTHKARREKMKMKTKADIIGIPEEPLPKPISINMIGAVAYR